MSVSPKDLYSVALQLLEQHSFSESHCRMVTSRAYYSAYHTLNEHYRPNIHSQSGMHARFIKSLTDSTDKGDKCLGYMLDDLHKHRIKADYFLSEDFSSDTAKMTVQSAKRILKKLDGDM